MIKLMKAAMVSVIAMVVGLSVGCNITPDTMKTIAQNAGMGSALTWIAYDNPSVEQKTAVKEVLDVIYVNVTNVEEGATFTSSLSPVVEKYVSESTQIKPESKPLVLAGALAALNGIDLLFVSYPEWKTNEKTVLSIVGSFVTGAKQGLGLSENDPLIINAQEMNFKRENIKAMKFN